MALDFSNICNWESLKKQTNYKEKGSFERDERFLKVESDENGKSTIIMRLLPDKNGVPFVNIKSVGWGTFDSASKKNFYCITDVPDAIGVKSPMQEFREFLWNCGNPKAVEECKNFSMPNNYITNAYIIKDSNTPENEGKVFLYKFGAQVLQKIQTAMVEDGVSAWNPLAEGANFKMRKRPKTAGSKMPTYEDSSVENPSSFKDLTDADEATEFIEKNTYELQEFLEKDYFMSYDELKNKMIFFLKKYNPKVLEPEEWADLLSKYLGEEVSGSSSKSVTQSKDLDVEIGDLDDEIPSKPKVKKEETPKKEEVPTKKEAKKAPVEDDDIDSLLAELDE